VNHNRIRHLDVFQESAAARDMSWGPCLPKTGFSSSDDSLASGGLERPVDRIDSALVLERRQVIPAARPAHKDAMIARSRAVKMTLNGEPYEVDGPLTVTELLARLDIDPRRVAVEHNLVVIKRVAFENTTINEGDQVEIVNFVGGG
jgi:thiamine biosynthesis protein ThiS